MKKALLVLVALAIATPAMAAKVVAVDNGNSTVTIKYVKEAGDTKLARAFGLNVTLNNGATFKTATAAKRGESTAANPGYGIFPGTINIVDGAVATDDDWGSPVGVQADLPSDTLAGIGSNGVTLELGSLYSGAANAPLTAAGEIALCTLEIEANAATSTDVVITANNGRGKVVAEDATELTVTFEGVTVSFSQPCMGDVDNDGWVTTDDLSLVVTALAATPEWYFETTAGDVRDLDGDGWITTDDLSRMVTALAGTPEWYYECGSL